MEIDLESFGDEVRRWLAENCEQITDDVGDSTDQEDRALQARVAAGGFAGLMIPKEYGGRGLTADHQRVFAREASAFRMPTGFTVSLGMLAPTLMEHGSEEQKRYHLPRMIRGEEVWIQLLSEPGGGSDLAGAVTKAERDGDSWVLNGSKIWSTGAATADVGMCLARTNWDAPKHRGLSMFAVPLRAPGVTIEPIRQANGESEFCQEFLDDVTIPLENLIGREDGGWSVAQTLLFHERNATGGVGHGEGSEGGRAVSQGLDELQVLAGKSLTDPTVIRRYLSEIFVRRPCRDTWDGGWLRVIRRGPWRDSGVPY